MISRNLLTTACFSLCVSGLYAGHSVLSQNSQQQSRVWARSVLRADHWAPCRPAVQRPHSEEVGILGLDECVFLFFLLFYFVLFFAECLSPILNKVEYFYFSIGLSLNENYGSNARYHIIWYQMILWQNKVKHHHCLNTKKKCESFQYHSKHLIQYSKRDEVI